MATPDDLRVNAEFIRMADQVEEVPGGTNDNNYANVNLIVDIAGNLFIFINLKCDVVVKPSGQDGVMHLKILDYLNHFIKMELLLWVHPVNTISCLLGS